MKNEFINNFSCYTRFFNLLILFFQITFSIEQLINNIIQLGGEDFRYIHFSLNSKGDMIIDTTANPVNNERRFFGLKKNGRPYFYNENNIETPYRSLFVNNPENENQQKIEGESNFIILSRQNNNEIKEYLLSFSKLDNNVELYDFDKNEIIIEKTSKLFNNNNITSDINTFIKSRSKKDNNYNYYIAYIHYLEDSNQFKFYILRCYFISKDIKTTGYHFDTGSRKSTINKAIASCFETEAKKIICFYQNENNLKYQIVTLDEEFNSETQKYTTLFPASEDIDVFFKAIHLRDEIGIFIYYKSIDNEYPILSLKFCDEDNIFYNYKDFGNININKISFNSNAKLNDIIKINENKICFIST